MLIDAGQLMGYVLLAEDGELGRNRDFFVDDSFPVLFNAHHESIPFKLLALEWGKQWTRVLDTGEGGFFDDRKDFGPQKEISVQSRSLALS